MKVVLSVQKAALTVTYIDVQDDEVVKVTEDDEVTLTGDEIGNFLQDAFSEEELGTG